MLLTLVLMPLEFLCIGQEFMLSSISTVDIRPVSIQADWDLLMFLLIFLQTLHLLRAYLRFHAVGGFSHL